MANFPSAPAGATCDQCAEGGKHCTVQGDCYICDDCTGFHERAIRATATAMMLYSCQSKTRPCSICAGQPGDDVHGGGPKGHPYITGPL